MRTGAERRAAPAGGGAARARHRDGFAEPARWRGAHAESEWARRGRDERDAGRPAGGPRGGARYALRAPQPRARLSARLRRPGRRRLPSRRVFGTPVGFGIGDL